MKSLRDRLPTREDILRWRRYWPAAAMTAIYIVLGMLNHTPAGFASPDGKWELATPTATSGDEPHYLVIVHSLLFDHDARLDPDFPKIERGGWQAGAMWRGHSFGGHTILVDPRTRRHKTCGEACSDRDAAEVGAPLADLEQYPAHPIGYPAFLALLLLPFHPAPENVEGMVGVVNSLVSIAGVILTYAAARRTGLATKPALASAALLGFASPWLPYVKSYFAEPSIGMFLVLGFFALRSRRPALCGVSVSAAMAMKPLFLLFGLSWIVERLFAKKLREAIVLTATIGVCGLALTAWNLVVLRSLTTTGTVPFAVSDGLTSLIDTFVHDRQGLVWFVPWAPIPLVWGLVMSRPGAQDREGLVRVEARRQMMAPVLLCLTSFGIIAWGPGYCYGPRYWVPLLPYLAILTVDFAIAGTHKTLLWRKTGTIVLAAIAAVFAVAGVVQYHVLFSQPVRVGLLGGPVR